MKEWMKIQAVLICVVLGTFAYIAVVGAIFGAPQTVLGLLAFTLPGANLFVWGVSKFTG